MIDKKIYKILILIFLFIFGILYNKLTLYENFAENILDNNTKIHNNDTVKQKKIDIIENYSNMIDNYDKIEDNFTKNMGNQRIKLSNPGKDSYVIQQTGKIDDDSVKNYYPIQISTIKPNTSYKVSSWVSYTDDWDGKYNIYNLVFDTDYGKTKVLSEKGTVIDRKKVQNLLWELREYSFNSPVDSTKNLKILLGYDANNKNGYRYFTDLELFRDYPLIPKLPIAEGIISFHSTHLDKSKNLNSSIWKDLTMEGNDIKFDSNIDNSDKQINISNNKGVGSNSISIMPKISDFTIFWSGEFETFTSGLLFHLKNLSYEILISIQNYSNESYLVVSVKDNFHVRTKNKKILWKNLSFQPGIITKYTQFCLISKDSKIELFVDGKNYYPNTFDYVEVLEPKLDLNYRAKRRDDTRTHNYIKKKYNNFFEHFVVNRDDDRFLINPQKQIKGFIETLIIYDKGLSVKEITELNKYVESTKYNIFDAPNINKTNIHGNHTSIITRNSIICPFNDSKKNSPCNSVECCGTDWSDLDNIPDKCKINVKDYCNNDNGDNTCNYLNKVEIEKHNKQTCSSSNKIFQSLKQKQLNIDKKILELTNSNSCENELTINNETKNNYNRSNSKTKEKKDMSNYVHKDLLPNMDNYLSKDDVEKNYITMNELKNIYIRKDQISDKYIRKDKIPCWGCKLD
tara:strand:+ start:1797 stop:3848 length:2052 start_codon:yes stop_codon:yes gene_type:complete